MKGKVPPLGPMQKKPQLYYNTYQEDHDNILCNIVSHDQGTQLPHPPYHTTLTSATHNPLYCTCICRYYQCTSTMCYSTYMCIIHVLCLFLQVADLKKIKKFNFHRIFCNIKILYNEKSLKANFFNAHQILHHSSTNTQSIRCSPSPNTPSGPHSS